MEVALEAVAAFGAIASKYPRLGSTQGLRQRVQELVSLGLLTLQRTQTILHAYNYVYRSDTTAASSRFYMKFYTYALTFVHHRDQMSSQQTPNAKALPLPRHTSKLNDGVNEKGIAAYHHER